MLEPAENTIMKPTPHALGRHILLELYDCPTHLLKQPAQARAFLLAAAEVMQATVVSAHFHTFSPYGVSGVVIIQESHLTIHTWPEYEYAAVDIFTCGEIDLDAGVQHLVEAFEAANHQIQEIARGLDLVKSV